MSQNMIMDSDLLSMQHARIIAENAFEAQKRLAGFSQDRLDAIVAAMVSAVEAEAKELAVMSHDETDCGRWQDKLELIRFACGPVATFMRPLRCVGVLAEDHAQDLMEIGVPMGVVAVLLPVASPVAAAVHLALAALKAGNAVLFSPHPRAAKSTARTVELLVKAAEAAGLPAGCLACLEPASRRGAAELVQHRAVAMIVNCGVPSLLDECKASGKPMIYGGTGHGPAFIERTADIAQAARDIVRSKSFDNGMAPAAEQAVVVDACVAPAVREALKAEGCHFMTPDETRVLAELIHSCGRFGPGILGMAAPALARRAGFPVPADTRVLVAEREYVNENDPYSEELLAPVLSFYTEADWRHACEKCIELLLHEHKGHTLVIHSRDEAVIRQFALKKPVGRLLVNTPASFGAMGFTTNLTPSLTLGSGSAGHGITADNVSPLHFIYRRKVGYGVRPVLESFEAPSTSALPLPSAMPAFAFPAPAAPATSALSAPAPDAFAANLAAPLSSLGTNCGCGGTTPKPQAPSVSHKPCGGCSPVSAVIDEQGLQDMVRELTRLLNNPGE